MRLLICIDMKNPFKKIKFSKKFFVSKTFLITTVLIAAAAIALGIGLGTAGKETFHNQARASLAEARYYLKQAQSDTLRVQFFAGMREEPYEMNGHAEKSTPFTIINVEPKNGHYKDLLEINGSLRIGEETVEITLTKNPFDRNFAADIERIIEPDKEIKLTLFLSETDTPTFTLENTMGENAINWERALEIAAEEMVDKVKGKKFEVYVKIISDNTQDANSFWYVQFIMQEGKTHFCVITPDGDIIG